MLSRNYKFFLVYNELLAVMYIWTSVHYSDKITVSKILSDNRT